MNRSSSSLSTSPSLIARASQHDATAWERLCRLYGPVIYGWAKASGMQDQDACDVMQNVFQSVTKQIDRFRLDGPGGFRGWLWTITRNKIRDFHRQRLRLPLATGGSTAAYRMNQLADEPPSKTSRQGQNEITLIWQRALKIVQSDFQPQTWQAFFRSTVNNEQPANIADDLGISVWTVYKARSRVLQRIREEFDGLLDF